MPGLCPSGSVYLSIINCNTWKNYWTDLHENFTTRVSVEQEEIIKFWKSSASRSRSSNFSKNSSTLRDMVFFHSLAYTSKESIWIFVKILSQIYPWTRMSPLNFESNPDPESGSGYGLRIQTRYSPWRRYAICYHHHHQQSEIYSASITR